METLGTLTDKLSIVNLKMFHAQEKLYEVRRMSYDEFKSKYIDQDGGREIYEVFQRSCNLNVQRQALIQELDEKLVEILKANKVGDIEDDYIKPQYKTY